MPDIRPRYELSWEIAVDYLASHAGRWVQGWELADAIYGGYCAPSAVAGAIKAARKYFPIESSRMGYRIGRKDVAAAECPTCGARRVRYQGDADWTCYGCPGSWAVDLEVGRAAYAEGTRGGKHWTDEEVDLALSLNATHTYEQIGQAVNRSGDAVRGLYTTLGIKKIYVLGERATGD